MNAKKILTYFFWFLMLILGFFGTVNGIAVSITSGYWHTAIAIAVLAWLAFPKWNEYRKKLMNGDD